MQKDRSVEASVLPPPRRAPLLESRSSTSRRTLRGGPSRKFHLVWVAITQRCVALKGASTVTHLSGFYYARLTPVVVVVSVVFASGVHALWAAAAGLSPTVPLVRLAAWGNVMSNMVNVTTNTNKMIVDSANSAVSIGRWSNLAIIAFSPFSRFEKAGKPLLRRRLLLHGFRACLGL
jgi:hypothetical protein